MSQITQRGATGLLNLFQGLAEAVTTAPFSQSFNDIGQKFDTADGRELVLVLNGAVALHAGVLAQSAPIVSAHQNCAVTAYTAASASGPGTVTVTLGATAVTANQYAGGFLNVNDNNGEGQLLQIASHPAAALSTSVVITLADAPGSNGVALTTASEVSLIPNPYNGVVVNPTTPTNAPVGVTLSPISASSATVNSFGFLVKDGITSCLCDATNPAVGTAIGASTATAGAIGAVAYAGNIVTTTVIGNTVQTGVSTEYRMVRVTL